MESELEKLDTKVGYHSQNEVYSLYLMQSCVTKLM
jgi:hypothetical protein